jgi:hypothetical protein
MPQAGRRAHSGGPYSGFLALDSGHPSNLIGKPFGHLPVVLLLPDIVTALDLRAKCGIGARNYREEQMPRTANRPPLPFRQRDISRALRGVAAGGAEVDKVTMTKAGEIVISVKSAAPEDGERAA